MHDILQAAEEPPDDFTDAEEEQEEDHEEFRFSPKRKRAPRPSNGTPGQLESLEEVEQRLQPGSVKHAIFQVQFQAWACGCYQSHALFMAATCHWHPWSARIPGRS